jgi:mono/diheme cytochrome c family protein
VPHRPTLRRLLPALLLVLVAACGGDDTPDPLADGIRVFGRMCSSCHGNQGQGGIGPPLASVAEDFPSCADHIEWVTVGSTGWSEVHGDTYGAAGKPITGGMPAFGATLSGDEIAAVAAFERHRHAGVPLEVVLADCGVPAAGG